jgi:hypothetical protein
MQRRACHFIFCWPCISVHLCDKKQLDALFIISLFVSQSLHVSGIFVAHHREVYCIYTTTGTCCAFQLTSVGLQVAGQQIVNWKAQHVPIVVYIKYTSWWWVTNIPETCRGWRNKLRINGISSCFLLNRSMSIDCLNSHYCNVRNCSQLPIFPLYIFLPSHLLGMARPGNELRNGQLQSSPLLLPVVS